MLTFSRSVNIFVSKILPRSCFQDISLGEVVWTTGGEFDEESRWTTSCVYEAGDETFMLFWKPMNQTDPITGVYVTVLLSSRTRSSSFPVPKAYRKLTCLIQFIYLGFIYENLYLRSWIFKMRMPTE